MARLYLVIDGYNLMHAAGLGRSEYGPGELERNRQRLLNQVAGILNAQTAHDALIVFDAHLAVPRASDEDQPLQRSPMAVRFSRDGRDADAEIELILETHSSPRQVLIVSSDHRLHKAAARRKARCIDSEDFLRQFDEPEPLRSVPRKPSQPHKTGATKPQPRKSTEKIFQEAQQAKATEAEDYLEDFLMIDVSDIKRSVRKEKL
ncbi:MAG: NYN domain-containing protein [Planctomycetaceae bacterium]